MYSGRRRRLFSKFIPLVYLYLQIGTRVLIHSQQIGTRVLIHSQQIGTRVLIHSQQIGAQVPIHLEQTQPILQVQTLVRSNVF